jgi:GTP-binding protein
LGSRRAELRNMQMDGKGRVRLDYSVPSRGLIGFHTEFLTSTSGTGLMYHVFEKYGPAFTGNIGKRLNGVLIANCVGMARGFALFNLQERGRLFLGPQTMCYEGMIVGIHSRDNDLNVNVTKEKQLTNMRASGTDENIVLTPPIKLSLEQALEFIDEDELVEVTPTAIRLRKKALKQQDRKRAG